MEKHTKDEINFRGFLTAYRTMQGVEMQALTKGLYSKSMMSRVESGERLPKKLERDRLVARLGVSGEGYEDYLSMDEHDEWMLRQQILESIEEKNIEKLEEQLKIYASADELDKVESQFLEAMRFMLLQMKNAPERELRKTIELAVSYTIEDIDDGFPEALILADQEINLLIEYVSLHKYSKNAANCRQWRLDRYKDIGTYIDRSYMDNIGKVKVYTKLVYYICKEYMNGDSSLEDLQKCLTLCNEGIELIRDTRKMYYFVELLDMRQWNIERMLVHKVFSEEYRKELKETADTSRIWAEMLIGLYREYDVSPYMENFAYLYVETESHCINDVVRIRRKMMKMTQKALAGEVCDIKTVRRTERREMAPQMYAVRGMFENLGLCPEYVRARVISTNAETFVLKRQLSKYSNERNVEKWKETLDKLENALCMDIVQNKQAVYRERILLAEHTKEISNMECVERLKDLLELTVRVEMLHKVKELYLTIEEIAILYNLATRIKTNRKNRYLDILRTYCNEKRDNKSIVERMVINEFVITGISSHLGNINKKNESNELSDEMIRISLANRRMRTLARNLYNKCWNQYDINGTESLARENEYVKNTLFRCILLSDMAKDEKLRDAFAKKMKD
ncbi:MAG: hypothetical protein E7283_03630 [Lachnospiraceae bacterium]|nr:hypothetical protein [Lachnospiraceae bacterium]